MVRSSSLVVGPQEAKVECVDGDVSEDAADQMTGEQEDSGEGKPDEEGPEAPSPTPWARDLVDESEEQARGEPPDEGNAKEAKEELFAQAGEQGNEEDLPIVQRGGEWTQCAVQVLGPAEAREDEAGPTDHESSQRGAEQGAQGPPCGGRELHQCGRKREPSLGQRDQSPHGAESGQRHVRAQHELCGRLGANPGRGQPLADLIG